MADRPTPPAIVLPTGTGHQARVRPFLLRKLPQIGSGVGFSGVITAVAMPVWIDRAWYLVCKCMWPRKEMRPAEDTKGHEAMDAEDDGRTHGACLCSARPVQQQRPTLADSVRQYNTGSSVCFLDPVPWWGHGDVPFPRDRAYEYSMYVLPVQRSHGRL